MSTVAIVTDSVASIPPKISKELNIHVVPYYIHISNDVFRDLVNIQCEGFYKWLQDATEFPTTANPSSFDYEKVYTGLIQGGIKEILSIHISSKGSGAFQAACIAKSCVREKFPGIKVETIDSKNVSMCQGWMVIEAARAAINGSTLDSIINLVKDMLLVTKMLQTADTLRYLYKGGRIGKAKHLMGSLLKIKPIISMENGEIISVGQERSRKKAYMQMVKLIKKTIGDNRKIKIAYMHAAAFEEINQLKLLIEENFTVVESIISELSPALGVHTGPGTTGLCYFPVNN